MTRRGGPGTIAAVSPVERSKEDTMLSDLMGLIVSMAPILGVLAWRQHVDRRQHAADIARADVHASAIRALHGESMLAINVAPPTAWRPGSVRLSIPSGCEPLIEQTFQRVLERVPSGYDVVIRCGEHA
jgi:hypothetical protein